MFAALRGFLLIGDGGKKITLLIFERKCNRLMKPMVSIGICVKNCEAFVKEAVASVLSQDFPHELMEVIVADDGSKDRTLSIVLDLASKADICFRVFHTEWRGLGYVRDLVVKETNGKYIVWVDGDMILPPDHVRKQVEFMEREQKVGIAKARYGTQFQENFVGFLENAASWAIDFKYGGRETTMPLGTGGCIYRVDAIRQVGGFDEHLKGVGEDQDVEFQIRRAGWLLYRGASAFFYEKRRETWKSLWKEYFWHGYGGHFLFKKNSRLIPLYKLVPPAGFLAGVWYSMFAYRATGRNLVFLLPIQYSFKRTAWFFGFIKSQIDDFFGRLKKGL